MRSEKAMIAPYKTFIYILYSFFILIALGAFLIPIQNASRSLNQIDEDIEKHILETRAFSSPECFAYADTTGRVYDRIDLSRFNDKVVQHCMNLSSYGFAIRFLLEHRGSDETHEASTSEWYSDYSYESSFNVPVLVQDSGDVYPGTVVVEYQTSPKKRGSR
ncbi:MAG: hypothetical protein ACLFNK_00570 [Candidatus Woesearchaeota archaeon]